MDPVLGIAPAGGTRGGEPRTMGATLGPKEGTLRNSGDPGTRGDLGNKGPFSDGFAPRLRFERPSASIWILNNFIWTQTIPVWP